MLAHRERSPGSDCAPSARTRMGRELQPLGTEPWSHSRLEWPGGEFVRTRSQALGVPRGDSLLDPPPIWRRPFRVAALEHLVNRAPPSTSSSLFFRRVGGEMYRPRLGVTTTGRPRTPSRSAGRQGLSTARGLPYREHGAMLKPAGRDPMADHRVLPIGRTTSGSRLSRCRVTWFGSRSPPRTESTRASTTRAGEALPDGARPQRR